MNFWTSYVLAKEQNGIPRTTTLGIIEAKKGLALRQSVETELAAFDASLLN